jgi:hypothetical protein
MALHEAAETAPQDAVRCAVEMRREAELMMVRLLCDRQRSEQHDAELGRPDPMKDLTGCSAFDRAVTAIEAMIEQLDAIIARRSNGKSRAPAPVITVIPRRGALEPASTR